MQRSRKIFIAFVIVFVLFLAYASYDFGRRTSFPGSKPPSEIEKADSAAADTVRGD